MAPSTLIRLGKLALTVPYVVYRRDGYLVITRRRSPRILNHLLQAYKKMHWSTRMNWLMQYGNVHAVPSIIKPYLDDFVGIHLVEDAVSIANSIIVRVLEQAPAGNRILINTLRKFPFRLAKWLTEPIKPQPIVRKPREPVEYFEFVQREVFGLESARWVVEDDDYGIARFKKTTWIYMFDDEWMRVLIVRNGASLEDILDAIIDNEEVGEVVFGIVKRIHEFGQKCPEDCHILNLLRPLAKPGD